MVSEAWARQLSPEKRAMIRELHRLQPGWNLVPLVFVSIWAAAAWAALHWPVEYVRWPAYVVIGAMIDSLGILMHEGIHGNLFRKPRLDRWLAFAFGTPGLISSTAWKVIHRRHHDHTGTERDPEEFSRFTRNPRIQSILFWLVAIAGTPIIVLYADRVALREGNPAERRAVVLECTFHTLATATLLVVGAWMGFLSPLLHVWVIPLIFAAAFSNIRGWSEHRLTRGGHPLTQSRTVKSNALVSFFMCNLNYHLEHHLFPRVPWYHLPRLHALLKEEYDRAGVQIRSSYLRFIWDAAKAGAHRGLDEAIASPTM
jgi:fatty acid desaturase